MLRGLQGYLRARTIIFPATFTQMFPSPMPFLLIFASVQGKNFCNGTRRWQWGTTEFFWQVGYSNLIGSPIGKFFLIKSKNTSENSWDTSIRVRYLCFSSCREYLCFSSPLLPTRYVLEQRLQHPHSSVELAQLIYTFCKWTVLAPRLSNLEYKHRLLPQIPRKRKYKRYHKPLGTGLCNFHHHFIQAQSKIHPIPSQKRIGLFSPFLSIPTGRDRGHISEQRGCFLSALKLLSLKISGSLYFGYSSVVWPPWHPKILSQHLLQFEF